MKNNIFVLVLISVMIFLTSCGKTEEKKLAEQAGKIMEEVGNIQNQMMKLDENLNEMDEVIDNNTKKMSEDDIPSWAKKVGLRKVNGLDFNEKTSEIIKKEGSNGFDAVNLDYTTSNYDEAIKQAESLAKDLGITESEMSPRKSALSVIKNLQSMGLTEEQMKEMQGNMDENMKGAMFVNCVLGMGCKVEDKFAKLISVEQEGDKWSLKTSIVNIEHWQKEMDKHGLINN
ncbi:MAG: hypothetical protein QM490_00950 [Candidatus Gracilibacteria bacterium]